MGRLIRIPTRQPLIFNKVKIGISIFSDLPCCQEAESQKCRSTCESVLKRLDDLSNIEEALVEDCGPPAINSVIWLCFLKKDQPIDNKDLIPYDIAKLHCCEKVCKVVKLL